ncbi:MAG: AIPR family protein [bacterium]
MTVEDYYNELYQDVLADADCNRNNTGSAFIEKLCGIIEEQTGNHADMVEYKFTQRGYAVDAWTWEFERGHLFLILSDFRDDIEMPSITKTEMESCFKRMERFVDACSKRSYVEGLEDAADVVPLARHILDSRVRIKDITFVLITNARLSARVSELPTTTFPDWESHYDVWDIERLYQLEASGRERESIKVDFTDFDKKGLRCLAAFTGDASMPSYLLVLPGQILAELYKRYGERLFEQNVRTFLQFRGKVNKGIRNTIVNEPRMFFPYNNGLSATAETVETSKDGERLLSADNLQIVNGGQTTASIFTAWHENNAPLTDIYVQVKLSVVESAKVNEIVPRISEYANTQNKVNAADFFSNHPFHLRIEDLSRRLWAPAADGNPRQTHWFYERARGQFINKQAGLSSPERKKFLEQNPKQKMFTKTDLAKVYLSFEEMPYVVSKGAQKAFADKGGFASLSLIREWEKNESRVNELWFKQAISKIILFRELDHLIRQNAWFEPYKNFKACIVSYTLAKAASIVRKKGMCIDFGRYVWQTQQIPSALAEELVSLAKAVTEHLKAGGAHIGEWAKRELCWQRVEAAEMVVDKRLDEYLINIEDEIHEERVAKKEQRVVNGIQVQTYVIEMGIAHWRQLEEWGHKNQKLIPKEMGILSCACQGRLLSEAQSRVLVDAEKRAKAEGFFPKGKEG